MYYDDFEEIINNLDKWIDGVSLKNIFSEKYGGGSTINMNKALRKLREHKKVKFKKEGRKIFYKKL